MPDQLNWGLLGTARINRAVIPWLQTSSRNNLLAVASRSTEKSSEYARQWSIPRAYGSYEELLADPQVQVIYISLPNHLHAEWTIRACQHGKHVLCEKPLCLSLPEADAIARAAEENHVHVAEAFMYRHHPQTEAVRELVASGALGAVHLIQGTFSFFLERPEDIRWLTETGGGSLWDVGCYPVSYARMITGELPAEVSGQQVLMPTGVDSLFSGQLRYASGVLAQISSAFILAPYARITIRGEEGTLEIPEPYKPGAGAVGRIIRSDQVETVTFPDGEIYAGEVEQVADVILNGAAPRIPLSESRENIATLLALLESARVGLPVML